MANIKLLSEAIQAFMNGDNEVADKKMRRVFVEQAQEINKQLEEEMEEESVCEDINGNPESSFTDEVGYKLEEEDEEDEFSTEVENDDGEEEFETSTEVTGEVPNQDQWSDIKSAFDDLEQMFAELESGEEFSTEEEDESGEFSPESGEGEEFGEVQFGDEKFGESYQMKPVPEVKKTEGEGINKKSVVASNAESPVPGVKPVKINDGTVVLNGDEFKNADALDAKVEDHNNVMDNGRNLMKPVAAPTNTAEKSRSVLPSSAGKK